MGAYKFPDNDTPIRIGKEVAVIGGGNTAMDAVRTAKRLGAENAYLIYRRSRQEMPAREEEIHHAEQEGIEFLLLTNPTRILGDGKNWVDGIECQRMELGRTGRVRDAAVRCRSRDRNSSWRFRRIVEAIGQKPNPIIQSTTPGLDTSKRGTVVTNETAGNEPTGDLRRRGSCPRRRDGDPGDARRQERRRSNPRLSAEAVTSGGGEPFPPPLGCGAGGFASIRIMRMPVGASMPIFT